MPLNKDRIAGIAETARDSYNEGSPKEEKSKWRVMSYRLSDEDIETITDLRNYFRFSSKTDVIKLAIDELRKKYLE
jgi:hypothetical protein